LILDETSPRALAVDKAPAPSAARLHRALAEGWPRLAGRIEFVVSPLEAIEILPGDVVVSIHACGRLTDVVLQRAIDARARVAVLPCCHDLAHSDAGGLSGWIDKPLAIDVMRARRLAAERYRIWTQTIPAEITPKNRLLIGAPHDGPAVSS
jgi:hypothetical protein